MAPGALTFTLAAGSCHSAAGCTEANASVAGRGRSEQAQKSGRHDDGAADARNAGRQQPTAVLAALGGEGIVEILGELFDVDRAGPFRKATTTDMAVALPRTLINNPIPRTPGHDRTHQCDLSHRHPIQHNGFARSHLPSAQDSTAKTPAIQAMPPQSAQAALGLSTVGHFRMVEMASRNNSLGKTSGPRRGRSRCGL